MKPGKEPHVAHEQWFGQACFVWKSGFTFKVLWILLLYTLLLVSHCKRFAKILCLLLVLSVVLIFINKVHVHKGGIDKTKNILTRW